MSSSEHRRKMALAIDMMASGIQMMRMTLRRRFPTDSVDQAEQRLQAWLNERPPDGPGKPISWEAWLAKRSR